MKNVAEGEILHKKNGGGLMDKAGAVQCQWSLKVKCRQGAERRVMRYSCILGVSPPVVIVR